MGLQSIQPSPIQSHKRRVLPPILPLQSYLDSNPQTNKEDIVIQSVAEIHAQKSLSPCPPIVSPSTPPVTPISLNCVSDVSIEVHGNRNDTFYNTIYPPVPSNTPTKSIKLPSQIHPLNLSSPSPPISFLNMYMPSYSNF